MSSDWARAEAGRQLIGPGEGGGEHQLRGGDFQTADPQSWRTPAAAPLGKKMRALPEMANRCIVKKDKHHKIINTCFDNFIFLFLSLRFLFAHILDNTIFLYLLESFLPLWRM